jgi:23S rRNA (uracil1939-C5)-methyltransferase
MTDVVVRIAARGDGVTASGKHVPFGVPGDRILGDGTILRGPNHQVPPCRHFPECGGCQLQHVDDGAYRGYLVSRVETALAQHGLTTEIREPHLSPPKSRRRASLRAVKVGQGAVIGFNAAKSSHVVDMQENHILRVELLELVAPLRKLLGGFLRPRRTGEVQMTLVNQGVDLLLAGIEPEGYEAMEALTAFCERHGLARLSMDQGFGAETLYEPVPATITLSNVAIAFPVGGFLQATADGEQALIGSVHEAVGSQERTADLFAGLGTFALSLPGKVYAAEASRDAVHSLKRAAPAVATEHRDLYRRPLDDRELRTFDAVVLDPPRAGAEQQVTALAGSDVRRIAYVSCNPATFARDSKLLVDGGYKLEWVRPVGQFRWSTHVELAAAFAR